MRFPLLLLTISAALTVTAHAAPPDGEALARRLLNSQGCKACHLIDGAGGSTGPDLSKVGSRLTQQQLRARLANPQKRHATGRIGDFSHLQPAELDALAAFLGSRK